MPESDMPRPIQVFIDVRDLRIAKTGAKTVLEEICLQLKKGYPGFTIHFIDTPFPVYTGKNKWLKALEHARFFGWKQITLPIICLVRGCDILFCTDYFLPLFPVRFKTAVIFYDAFFWQYPEQYNRFWLKLLHHIAVPAARKASAIITISHHSKEQIVQCVGLPPEKIHAIHLAPKSSSAIVSADYHTSTESEKKYILHIGVLEKRKNLLNLIKAFALLRQAGYHNYNLVLAGGTVPKHKLDDSGNIRRLIKELQLEDAVILPGFISDEALAHYYQQASLYAFVSVNEGFGLPILEAFQHRLPTLIANNSCLPEVGGDAVITCDPYDPADIAEKMKLVVSNPALQEELIQKGLRRLQDFSWEKTTEELMQVFRELMKEKN
jgi:glycosyltransferase involved in cell wall biosynthesis